LKNNSSSDASEENQRPSVIGSAIESVSRIQFALLGIGLLVLLTAPVWGEQYLFLLSIASIWAILAMGWDIISGHTGYISFGHSALSGSAAYTTAMLVTHVNPDMPMVVTMIASVAVAFGVGMLFALPSLRLSGPYFSLLTLLMVLFLGRLVNPFSQWTGGELGLSVPPLSTSLVTSYYMTLLPMFVIAAALLYVSQSNVGIRRNSRSERSV
jgi:branched-chain amino acid transport system permease protein